MIAVGVLASVAACSSAPVDRSTNQTRSGVLAADQGSWEEAEFRWLKALAIANLNSRALNNLAVRFEREGEFDRAKEYYDRALVAAGPADNFYVQRNYGQFEPIWARIASGDMEEEDGNDDSEEGDLAALPFEEFPQGENPNVGVLEIVISVPDQGPNLAGYDRVLIGNFVPHEDSEANINEFAVRYFRRRVTQRTFFETQDLLERALDPELAEPDVFDNAAYWVTRAADVEADLIMTGSIGLSTRDESQMVRERIRSPDGQIREVARFQDSVVYRIVYDLIVLRGEDGERLLAESFTTEASFPADEGISESEAVFEALEQLLGQVLDTVTPRRSEQSRYLIY